MTEPFVLHRGDCLEVMRTMPDNSVDSIVCDPPYGLSKEPDMLEVLRHWLAGDDYKHTGSGFMGKSWDSFVPGPSVWREALRVLKPGGHLLAFFGSRTYDIGTLAIRIAGFEIRDQIMWLYGSGFPKSLNVSKAIDKAGGQPWAEFANLLDRLIKDAGFNYMTLDRALGIPSAGSNSCYWVRTDDRGGLPPRHYYERLKELLSPPIEFTDLYDKAEREVIAIERRKNAPSGIVSAGRDAVEVDRKITAPATDATRQWQGWGTALKPAHEPICVARKPLISTVAANVLQHDVGALNIDACRVETSEVLRAGSGGIPCRHDENVARGRSGEASADRRYTEEGGTNFAMKPGPRGGDLAGRWPANVIHDGSPEVLAAFPDAPGQIARSSSSRKDQNVYGAMARGSGGIAPRADLDKSAARFFYCAKASRADRNHGLEDPGPVHKHGVTLRQMENAVRDGVAKGNTHPTVKPTDLMAYLCRLVTPPGGVVLDPFMGSGSTGKAAMREGFRFIGIERDEDESGQPLGYMDIASARIAHELAKVEADRAAAPAPSAQLDLLDEAVA